MFLKHITLIASILATLIASPALADTYRVRANGVYYDYEISPKQIQETIEDRLVSDSRDISNLEYRVYSPARTFAKTADSDKVMLRTPGARDKEYATVQLAQSALALLECGDIISLEQPVGSRSTQLIDEKPCFDEV
jgi:hypothetical protein